MKRSTSFTTVKLYANMSLKIPEYSKSSKRESVELFKIQQERERSYSKSSNRERDGVVKREREREEEEEEDDDKELNTERQR